jgi:hypothetical protein
VVDPETFLLELYVLVDEYCKRHLPAASRPGPAASLSPSEVVTLAIHGQWARFASEAAFYRHADGRLRPLFPTLPSRAQFNRLVRAQHGALAAFARHLGEALAAGDRAYEVVDGTGLVTRNAKRRGRGWLWGQADTWASAAWGASGIGRPPTGRWW